MFQIAVDTYYRGIHAYKGAITNYNTNRNPRVHFKLYLKIFRYYFSIPFVFA